LGQNAFATVQCCSVKEAHSMDVSLQYIYGDLLFIQVCSDATLMHCSIGQAKRAFSVFSAALQTRLTAGTVPLPLLLATLNSGEAILP